MSFKEYLIKLGKSENTIAAYLYTVRLFNESFSVLDEKNIMAFKTMLIDQFSPRTANLRISAMNAYLDYSKTGLKITTVRYQQQTFIENVISFADYEHLKKCLYHDGNHLWYFIIRFLGSTGSRINELLQFKVEHIVLGHADLYAKGGKIRRIYIPDSLATDALNWLEDIGVHSGFIFLNARGSVLTAKGVSSQLKKIADKYGVQQSVVYPHSFRHMFAKTFMQRYNDIALLADLLGHESIETTRIYLRMTSDEQRAIVNRTVDW